FVKATPLPLLACVPLCHVNYSLLDSGRCRCNSAMQIFLGACLFFVAVVMLGYLPGKMLLILLRRTLSPLEDATLACVLGLVMSAVAYWLITFANQGRFYFVWPTAVSICVWLLISKRKSLLNNFVRLKPCSQGETMWSRDGSALVLAGILAL